MVDLTCIIEAAEATLADWIAENAVYVRAESVGLDSRCGSIWVSESGVICTAANLGRLNYYGGFEYVDASCRMTIGNYTIFYAEDDRVAGVIENYQGELKGRY
jgi:hypothetical protein